MITEPLYNEYFGSLLEGRKDNCHRIVGHLLEHEVEIQSLYLDLFQRSLYAVGELWERNRISVAREHLATAITEGVLNLVYPHLFEQEPDLPQRKILISCAANEYHQVGGKMVADLFEMQGWEGHFLGANTPVDHMLTYIQETKPDLVGLSLSVYFNLPALKTSVTVIRSHFQHLDILLGGQAFRWGGSELTRAHTGIHYIPSIRELGNEFF